MTATDKIKTFRSLDDLTQEIENDRQSHDILLCRYPVRFILLDNFNLFQELILKLSVLNVKIFDLETLIEDKDDWITKDELANKIREFQGNYIISPVSEIVRFYEESKFKAFSQEIALLENKNNELFRRIYIPLIGLDSKFNGFLNSFARIAESAPVWSLNNGNAQPVTVYLTPSEDAYRGFSFGNRYQSLDTMYDWLTFWKTQAPVEKIICSSNPVNVNQQYARPDNIFTIQKIDNAYEFITKYLHLSVPIVYNDSDKEFWHKLLSELDKSSNTFSFDNFVKNHFKTSYLSTQEIIRIWSLQTSKAFDRWLLKNYIIAYPSGYKYLCAIVSNILDYRSNINLLYHIAFNIFNEESLQDYIKERGNLLRMFDKTISLCFNDQNELKNKILTIAKESIENAIALCTGKFDFEKELLIAWYSDNNISIQEIKNLYPDFADYLAGPDIDSWAADYIQEYKNAKISDIYTNHIRLTIAEKNVSEDLFYQWYYQFPKIKDLLSKYQYDKLYWLDGVGIEWLSLIKNYIEKSTFQIQNVEIAVAEIPSSTEHNHFEEAEKKENLDNYIHNNVYRYPKTLCDEIDIVKQMMSDVLNQSQKMVIAIVSDHGLTALSRLVDAHLYTTKASHEGRYIEVLSSGSLEDKNYLRHQNGENHYKVALTHASLNKKPVREVHGGCTPEELLVPFIVVSNQQENTQMRQCQTKYKKNEITTIKSKGFEEDDLF
jgi:hypothetical protein